jgi:hypothetical protein
MTDWRPTPEQDAEIRRKAKAYQDYLEDYFKGWREMPDKRDLDRARKEYQQLLRKQENEAKNRN